MQSAVSTQLQPGADDPAAWDEDVASLLASTWAVCAPPAAGSGTDKNDSDRPVLVFRCAPRKRGQSTRLRLWLRAD